MVRIVLPLVASIALLLAAASTALAGDVRVVVTFKGHGNASPAAVEQAGGRVHRTLRDAVAADLSPAAIARLRADPDVASVDEDGVAEICAKPAGSGKAPPSQPSQVTPWGIARVGAPGASTGAGVKVAVIDTGIDTGHPDLNVQAESFTIGKSAKDDNGHGTHVAGTIAALDNDIGVIGVAPDAMLYAVKVLDRRGYGFWSDIAAGIEWAGDHGMHVANMSLGGGSSAVVQSACSYAFGKGVLLVAAAGNSGDGNPSTAEVSYPAAYDTVVAVAATRQGDALASFSNSFPSSWGPSQQLHPVEVAAPGVSVYSTLKGGGYGSYSGTSMASPHAAGVAALQWVALAATSSTVTVTAVRDALGAGVDDVGPTGWDTGYGAGIVQAP